jgi:hypothetical protein
MKPHVAWRFRELEKYLCELRPASEVGNLLRGEAIADTVLIVCLYIFEVVD